MSEQGTDWMWCWKKPREAAAEIDRLRNHLVKKDDALREAILQIDYLHQKFKATGTGIAVMSRLQSALTDETGK